MITDYRLVDLSPHYPYTIQLIHINRISYLADLEYSIKSSELIYHSLSLDNIPSVLETFILYATIDPPQESSTLPTLRIANSNTVEYLPFLGALSDGNNLFRRVNQPRNGQDSNSCRYILDIHKEQTKIPQGN